MLSASSGRSLALAAGGVPERIREAAGAVSLAAGAGDCIGLVPRPLARLETKPDDPGNDWRPPDFCKVSKPSGGLGRGAPVPARGDELKQCVVIEQRN